MSASVSSEQRHRGNHRCPICNGRDGDPRGKGRRCNGFTSSDGEWVRCSREEHAGVLNADNNGLFVHKMHGPCNCGVTHEEDDLDSDTYFITKYDYVDESGSLLFQVVRKAGKKFLQRRPDGAGGWIWKMDGVRRVPYRLPELIAAPEDAFILIVEGEKDADALADLGAVVTTNPGGAGKWHYVADLANKILAGRDIVVISDADDAGRKHAEQVAASLQRAVKSIRVIELAKKDAADFLASGGTIADIVKQARVAPLWTPPNGKANGASNGANGWAAGPPPDRFDDEEPTAEPTPDPETPITIIRRWRTEGPLVRIPTGIDPLDRMCRGGLPIPWRFMLVGAPSAGKTAIATIVADTLARAAHAAGACVGIHAVDEESDDITVRLLQIAGFSIAEAELRAAETLDDMESALASLRVQFYGCEHTIEAAATALHKWASAEKRPAVLVVDSLQAATSARAAGAKSPREFVEANIKAIRWASTELRQLTITTSEANRASYRTDDAADTTNDMAAGAESRAIEFAGQTQLVCRTPKGHADIIHVRVAKNRRADRGEFWLRLDRDRHTVTECPDPNGDPSTAAQRQEERRAAVRAEVLRDAEALAALLVRAPDGLGTRELRAALKSAGHKWGIERLDAARHALSGGHKGVRLVEAKDGKRVVSRLQPEANGGLS